MCMHGKKFDEKNKFLIIPNSNIFTTIVICTNMRNKFDKTAILITHSLYSNVHRKLRHKFTLQHGPNHIYHRRLLLPFMFLFVTTINYF